MRQSVYKNLLKIHHKMDECLALAISMWFNTEELDDSSQDQPTPKFNSLKSAPVKTE
jgi:hypothetical protein